MALPPRQIGQPSSSTDALLYRISQQLERLIKEVGASYTHTTTTTTTTI